MTLPYRTDGEDLERFIEALARGRSLEQVQTLNFSQKGFEGTVTAAECLGFALRDDGGLTQLGQKFALAPEAERRMILLAAMADFEPYSLLLEAIQDRGEGSTETEWIETWWSTHGFGSSSSNRAEGSSTFARFLEYAGAGAYVRGRRGHASRIEWNGDSAPSLPGRDAEGPQSEGSAKDSDQSEQRAAGVANSRGNPPTRQREADSQGVAAGQVELSLPLGPGRTVYLRLPPQLSPKERDRVLALLDHLIVATETEEGTD